MPHLILPACNQTVSRCTSEQRMNVTVVYGTVEGHTQKIANAVVDLLETHNHSVHLLDASRNIDDGKFMDCDACIIAAPVHQLRHPDAIINFIRAHMENLNNRPTALISVSLSAAFPDGMLEAQSYVDRLLERTGWHPKRTHLAAGALRRAEYDFFQEQIIQHIVLKDRSPEEIEGDHEFTDWNALNRFVKEFLEEANTNTGG